MRRSKKNTERFTKGRPRERKRRRHDVDARAMFEAVEYGGELWFVVDYSDGGAPIGLRVEEDGLEQHSDDDVSF